MLQCNFCSATLRKLQRNFRFRFSVVAKQLKLDKEVATSLFKEVEGKAMRAFCSRKQGVSRGLRPNLLIFNEGAITSLSLFKPFSSDRVLEACCRGSGLDGWGAGLLEARTPFCAIPFAIRAS